jgi:hypothetical protein
MSLLFICRDQLYIAAGASAHGDPHRVQQAQPQVRAQLLLHIYIYSHSKIECASQFFTLEFWQPAAFWLIFVVV